MFQYEWFGFVIIFTIGLVLTLGPGSSRFPRRVAEVLVAGVITHAIGTLLRYWVLYGFYDGGDAGRYYRLGLDCARQIWSMDFSFLDAKYWEYAKLWGTQAVIFFSGFVLSLMGPSKIGEFLFFSFISMAGLLFFCRAFGVNYPHADTRNYARWILFWPSLCFWPSSAGKDSLILLAAALVVYGYAGSSKRILWFSLLLGLLIASCVRPQVAGVLMVAIAVAHWVSPTKKWTAMHFLQGFLLMVVLALVLQQGLSSLGMSGFDSDDLRGYIGKASNKSMRGGSAITTPGLSVLGLPLAVVNVLFRPFPWEAGSILSAAACVEILLFWLMVIVRRRRIMAVMMEWRNTKLLRVAVPLTILYVVLLGLAIGNLGIIARQRIHVMPLLLIWLEALPLPVTSRQPVVERRRFPRIVPIPGAAH